MNNSPSAGSYTFWIEEIGKHLGEEQKLEALFCINKAIESAQTDIERVEALNLKGIVLYELALKGEAEHYDEASSVYKEIVRQFGNENNSKLKECVAKALNDQGLRLRCDDDNYPVGSLDVFDQVVHLFGSETDLELKQQVAQALINQGNAHCCFSYPERALEYYDEVIRRFGNETDQTLERQVAKAWFGKGAALSELGHEEEALSAFEKAARSFIGKTVSLKERVEEARARK